MAEPLCVQQGRAAVEPAYDCMGAVFIISGVINPVINQLSPNQLLHVVINSY